MLGGLKERREAAGLSMREAGQLIGVTKQQFAKLEAGANRLDVGRARTLATRLGCSIEALF